jgi:hypothetical protein
MARRTSVKVPTTQTIRAMQELQKGKGKWFNDEAALMTDLGISVVDYPPEELDSELEALEALDRP